MIDSLGYPPSRDLITQYLVDARETNWCTTSTTPGRWNFLIPPTTIVSTSQIQCSSHSLLWDPLWDSLIVNQPLPAVVIQKLSRPHLSTGYKIHVTIRSGIRYSRAWATQSEATSTLAFGFESRRLEGPPRKLLASVTSAPLQTSSTPL